MRNQILSLLLCGALAGAASGSGIHFLADPPAAPTTAAVIMVANNPLSVDMVLRRGAELGQTSTFQRVKTPSGVGVQWSSPASGFTTTLYRDQFGTDIYATSLMAAETPGAIPPIADTEATRIAQDFVNTHPGLLQAREAAITDIKHLIHQGQDLDTGGITPETQDETIVRFSRTLAGILVIGPGDQAEVHVANDGSVTGSIAQWRKVMVETPTQQILPYSAVQNSLIAQLTRELGNSPDDANITEIRFGYYSRAGGQPQRFYTPVYDFVVSFFNPELQQETGARHVYLPAVDPAMMQEPLDPPSTVAPQGTPASITYQASPPTNVPQAVPLFQVLPTNLNSDLISRRAQALGLKLPAIQSQVRGFQATDAANMMLLAQDTMGAEFFGHMDRYLSEKPGEASPIADGAALQLALTFLNSIGGFDSSQFGPPIFSHLFNQGFDTSANRLDNQTQDETIVTFPRQIPTDFSPTPVPLLGANSGIQVHVDNSGVVTGHHALWRGTQMIAGVVAQVQPYEMILPQFERIAASLAGNSRMIVTNIAFGYYERPEGVAQGFLQPAFVFDASLIDPDDPKGQATGHITIPIAASPTLFEPLDDETSSPNDPILTDDARDQVPTVYGDWNGDGAVDLSDVIGAIHGIGGLSDGIVTATQVASCDVAPSSLAAWPGGDGIIGVDDCLRILRSIYKLDSIADGP
ncbi:MAG TPA: hypothetical protein VGM51_02550 [Armatimonadota bacterium]|jgi:hypothetical protein